MTDQQLERLIEQALQAGLKATDSETRRFAFKRMAELIGQRSPRRIQQMERAMGLRSS
jgi:hypothetical protein